MTLLHFSSHSLILQKASVSERCCIICGQTYFQSYNSSIQTTKIDEDNNHILISVKDTGTGIDPEILPELFSKFMTKSFSGVGLGLFISKSIVEAHGDKIWAENNSDGNRTTFTFTLPLRG